ncbi:MAG TPA: hypothetical protein PLB76_00990 [Anaerohalosphaeraceae bacterium]|nr:hypothetical protein [Anaerohalosphaeraceae bacterium]
MKIKFLFKAVFLLLTVLFVLAGVAICQDQSAESISEFVKKYLECTAPERFADAPTMTPTKAKRFFLTIAKIHILKDNESTCTLSAEQYLHGLSKLNFLKTIQRHILKQPQFEMTGDEIKVTYLEGYLEDGYAEVSETDMFITAVNGKYYIKELSHKYRDPLHEELEQINIFCSPTTVYNPQKGLGSRYLGGGDFPSSISISPDNTQIVFTSLSHESSELYMMNLDGSNLKRLTKSPFWETSPFFTPDGGHILFLCDQESYQGDPYILKIADGEIRHILPQKRSVRNITYSPDGRIMGFTAAHGKVSEIFINDLDSNEIRQVTSTGREKIAFIFSSDGRNLIFSEKWYEYDKTPPLCVELFSIQYEGADIRRLTNDRSYKVPVAYTDDNRLFYIRREKANELWFTDNENAAGHLIISAVNGMDCAWLMPDESSILFIDDRNRPYAYDVFSVTLHPPYKLKKITNLSTYIYDLSVTKDGRFIALITDTSDSPGRGKGKIFLIDMVSGISKLLGQNY